MTLLDRSEPRGIGPLASHAQRRVALPIARLDRLALCGAIGLSLLAWALCFPHTGDGDAILHYLSARDALAWPKGFLSAWARWGALFPIILPAQFGILAARFVMILLSVACCWQTMEMADDLDMPRATLGGLLLILQPLVFALAGDTMTEMPMALWMVVAIRLWWKRRHAAACALASFLPAVRPEGFLIIPLWGLLALASVHHPWRRRIGWMAWLSLGVIVWMMLGTFVAHDPWYFHTSWNWPAGGYPAYGRGSLLHHVVRWPIYCGPVLSLLFVAGFWPAWPKKADWFRPSMALPLAAWWLFLVVHSILFWRGWFASVGLMRIFAATSPFTALICLRGWNRWEPWLRRRTSARALAAIECTALAIALATPLAYYFDDFTHFRDRPIARAAAWMEHRYLPQTAPALFLGDPIAADYLPLGPLRGSLIPNSCDPDLEREMLSQAPVGSIGMWDNQHAQEWFNLSIDDVQRLGFKIIYENDQTVWSHVLYRHAAGNGLQRYVVVEKAR